MPPVNRLKTFSEECSISSRFLRRSKPVTAKYLKSLLSPLRKVSIMLHEILFSSTEADENSTVLFPEQRTILQEFEGLISSQLVLTDLLPVRCTLATYAANHLCMEPLWLMLVAPPSSGKTALLSSLYDLPKVHVVGDISKGALLSGASAKERSKDSTGGLLPEIGEFGFIVFKDFTSIISKNREACSELLGALRETADGYYSRHFGIDGGTHKKWSGKLGLIAAVTPAIQKYRSVMSSMGDRFIFSRFYADHSMKMKQASKGLEVSGTGTEVKKQTQACVKKLFSELTPGMGFPIERMKFIHGHLESVAAFTANCRTPVERNSHSKGVEYIHQTEGYARLTKQLFALFCGCVQIGSSFDESWRVVQRAAVDTIPEQRASIIAAALRNRESNGEKFGVDDLMEHTRLSKSSISRIVEDLFLVEVFDGFRGTGRAPSEYSISAETAEQIEAFSEELVCKSEMSDNRIPTYGHSEYRTYKEEQIGGDENEAA